VGRADGRVLRGGIELWSNGFWRWFLPNGSFVTECVVSLSWFLYGLVQYVMDNPSVLTFIYSFCNLSDFSARVEQLPSILRGDTPRYA